MGRLKAKQSSQAKRSENQRFRLAGFFLGFFCLCLCIYWPCFRAPFMWDDGLMLGANIRSAHRFVAIWLGRQVDFIPMTSSVFWLTWRVWGDSPACYRLLNVGLHAGSALLVYQILRRYKMPGASLAACLFCVHPVCVATVAWVAELKNTLSMFFALSSLLLYSLSLDQGSAGSRFGLRQRSEYLASLLCFLLALLSKVSVVTLPFIIVTMDYFFGPRPRALDHRDDESSRRVRLRVRDLSQTALRTTPFFLCSIALGLVNVWIHRHHAMSVASAGEEEGLIGRLLGGGWALWFYLWKDLFPLNLLPVYPNWRIDTHAPVAWVPLISWLVLLGFAGWLWLRFPARRTPQRPDGRRGWTDAPRIVFFSLSYFWIALIPVLGVLQISYFYISRVSDHLQYVAIIGIMSMLANAFSAIESRSRRYVLSVSVVILLGLASFRRAELYGDPERLWSENIRKNPAAAMAWSNLAVVQTFQGRMEEAVQSYTESIKLDPDNPSVRENLAGALVAVGRLDDAISQYRALLQQVPVNPRGHSNLGAALARRGQYEDAVLEFQTALEQDQDSSEARKNLGAAYLRLGKLDEAIAELEQVLRANPNFDIAKQLLTQAKRQKVAMGSK